MGTAWSNLLGRATERYMGSHVVRAHIASGVNVLYNGITPVGNVGGGADDLMTFTMPAGFLRRNGQTLRITCWGNCGATDNDKTRILLFGGTSVFTSGAIDSNAIPWAIQAHITRLTATTLISYARALGNIGDAADAYNQLVTRTALTKTLADAQIIKMTGTGTADNDIVQEGMLIELINGGFDILTA